MSEALTTILQYGFKCKKFQFITAQIMLENIATRKTRFSNQKNY